MAEAFFDSVPENSLVIPVYRNEETIELLFKALKELKKRLSGNLEVIFVVDGCPGHSETMIEERLDSLSGDTQLVTHSRNFGSYAAIVTGLSLSRGSYCAVMTADLQEPLELIEGFFRVLRDPDVDIVVGKRESRNDGAISGILSNVFWFLFRKLAQPEIPRGGVDVFGCTRQIVKLLMELPESNSSLVGLLYWLGFGRAEIGYRRLTRPAGDSGWNFPKKFRYLSDSIFSFTTIPISLILAIGAVGSVLSVLLAIVVFGSWLTGAIEVQGYTTMVLVQLFSTTALLLAIGVVGTYVWRTFDNTKKRPKAVIRSRISN